MDMKYLRGARCEASRPPPPEGVGFNYPPAPLSIHLVCVPYDIELAIRQAHDDDMPSREPYAHELRTAQYRGPAEYAKERDALRKAHAVA
jgi:hypothetical protein